MVVLALVTDQVIPWVMVVSCSFILKFLFIDIQNFFLYQEVITLTNQVLMDILALLTEVPIPESVIQELLEVTQL